MSGSMDRQVAKTTKRCWECEFEKKEYGMLAGLFCYCDITKRQIIDGDEDWCPFRAEFAAEPEQRKGEWKFEYQRTRTMFSNTKVTCSKCGYIKSRADGEILNYCPNCGADMRGENNG